MSNRFLWIALVGLSLIFLVQGVSNKLGCLSNKITQAITETETSGALVEVVEE